MDGYSQALSPLGYRPSKDGVGFEPTGQLRPLVFKTRALNPSATHPQTRRDSNPEPPEPKSGVLPLNCDRIRGRRNELNLTQRELATRAGLNPKTIVFLEGGKTGGLYTTVQAVADALEVSVGYLEHGRV